MSVETLFEGEVEKGAVINPTGEYRWLLWRCWDSTKPRVLFVMLNPSTADAERDDPTIRRCIGFAKTWNFGSVEVANLFALRATNPALLSTHRDPIGYPLNNQYLLDAAYRAGLIVAAWGNFGSLRARDKHVRALLSLHGFSLHCLGTTQAGQPLHPLRLAGDLRPIPLEV